MPVEEALYLWPRILEVCRVRATCENDRQVAHRMGVSLGTVKNYLQAARRIEGVSTTLELMLILLRRGLIE